MKYSHWRAWDCSSWSVFWCARLKEWEHASNEESITVQVWNVDHYLILNNNQNYSCYTKTNIFSIPIDWERDATLKIAQFISFRYDKFLNMIVLIHFRA
jgi:hypothetical protein